MANLKTDSMIREIMRDDTIVELPEESEAKILDGRLISFQRSDNPKVLQLCDAIKPSDNVYAIITAHCGPSMVAVITDGESAISITKEGHSFPVGADMLPSKRAVAKFIRTLVS